MDSSKDLVFGLCVIIIPIAAIVSLISFRALVKDSTSSKNSAIKFGIGTSLGLSCSIPLYHTKVYWLTLTAFPFFLSLVFSMLAILFSLVIKNADNK